jgi:O-antigen ligase
MRASSHLSGENSIREEPQPADSRAALACSPSSSRLDAAVFICLLVFAAALPHSKAATQVAYGAALLLTAIRLALRRVQISARPLVWALVAFLALSAISSTLSPEPALSWGRMKSVALLVIAPVAALGLRNLRQIRTVVAVLLISSVASVAYVGWLYAYGIGAQLKTVPPGSPLYESGARAGDVIMAINGRRTRTPRAVVQEIEGHAPQDRLALRIVEGGEWQVRASLFVTRSGIMSSGITAPGVLGRARPPRARGALGYSVTYAEVMLQVALLAFGLLVAAVAAHQPWRWPLLAAFILFCAALGATLTRASLLSLLLAGFAVVWLVVPRRWLRLAAVIAVVAGLACLSLWVRRERGLGLIARNDAGTQYRVLMWEDGARLASEHPLFGVGMDTIKTRWQQFGIRAYQRFPIKSHFHSTPIQIAAERGLLALAAWVVLLGLYFRLLWRLWRRSAGESWWERGVALGICGASLGFVCSGFVHYNLGDSEVQVLFWFLMGTAMALARMQAAVPETMPQ